MAEENSGRTELGSATRRTSKWGIRKEIRGLRKASAFFFFSNRTLPPIESMSRTKTESTVGKLCEVWKIAKLGFQMKLLIFRVAVRRFFFSSLIGRPIVISRRMTNNHSTWRQVCKVVFKALLRL